MRNAAAHFDDDFDLVEPPRKKTTRRAASGKRPKKGKRFRFNVDMQKVARYGAIGMTATVAIGIMVNALMMQKGRHPAPLFGKSIPLGQPAAAVPPAPPKKSETKQAEADTPTKSVAAEAPDLVPAPVAKPAQTIRNETSPAKADAIAQLLEGAPGPSEKPATKTVLAAQRALVKLGFVLKPNGNFGPQTRKAIELFEKERHLPVKGELSRRVVKILAAESGLKIEH